MPEFDYEAFKAQQTAIYNAALTSPRTFAFTKMVEFNGRDGVGYSANVTRDGKVVGEITDEGNGGAPYLRLLKDDQAAFIAEGATFHPEGTEAWSIEEGYCGILALAATIARKRTICLVTDDTDLSGGAFMTLSGGSKDLAHVAAYLLNPANGLADKGPAIWVKAENRFVPAADLVKG